MESNNFDQNLAKTRDGLPRLWWALYIGCIEAGFKPDQSMGLLQTFILANGPYGTRPPNTFNPEQPDAS